MPERMKGFLCRFDPNAFPKSYEPTTWIMPPSVTLFFKLRENALIRFTFELLNMVYEFQIFN